MMRNGDFLSDVSDETCSFKAITAWLVIFTDSTHWADSVYKLQCLRPVCSLSTPCNLLTERDGDGGWGVGYKSPYFQRNWLTEEG